MKFCTNIYRIYKTDAAIIKVAKIIKKNNFFLSTIAYTTVLKKQHYTVHTKHTPTLYSVHIKLNNII